MLWILESLAVGLTYIIRWASSDPAQREGVASSTKHICYSQLLTCLQLLLNCPLTSSLSFSLFQKKKNNKGKMLMSDSSTTWSGILENDFKVISLCRETYCCLSFLPIILDGNVWWCQATWRQSGSSCDLVQQHHQRGHEHAKSYTSYVFHKKSVKTTLLQKRS
jgi:hypothetical protein